MKNKLLVWMLGCCILASTLFAAAAQAQHKDPLEASAARDQAAIKKILDNGPDSQRKVILVVGEGYAKQDAQKYENDVNRVVIQGLFGHDVFKEVKSGFNVYRADVWSKSSGCSQRGGVEKDTAFDIKVANNDRAAGYFGAWERNKKTTSKMDSIEVMIPKCDYFLMLLNDNGWGGESFINHYTLLTLGADWPTLLHEMGHVVGRLYDEYEVANNYDGPPLNEQNATSFADRVTVPWSSHLLSKTKVPTPPEEKPENGVGVYEGGATYKKGTYRPSLECRMRSSHEAEFCPYCKFLIKFLVNENLPTPKHYPGAEYKNAKLPLNMINYGFKITKSSLFSDGTGISPFAEVGNVSKQNFIAEAYDKTGTLNVALKGNPFEIRSIPRKGEFVESSRKAEEGFLFMNLPFKSKQEAIKNGVGLRIYGINDAPAIQRVNGSASEGESLFPGASPAQNPASRKSPRAIPAVVNKSTLRNLKSASRVKLLLEISGAK